MSDSSDKVFESRDYGHTTVVGERVGGIMLAVAPVGEGPYGGYATNLKPDEARAIAAELFARAEKLERTFKVGDVVETPEGNVAFVERVRDDGWSVRVRDCGTHGEVWWRPTSLTLLERDGKPAR